MSECCSPNPGSPNVQANDMTPPSCSTTPCPNAVTDQLVGNISVAVNGYGDHLPIIPNNSGVDANRVLYQLKLVAIVTRGGAPAPGETLSLTSSRQGDVINPASTTSAADGTANFVLQTRAPGALVVNLVAPGVTSGPLSLNLLEAWYEAGFEVTAYNVCSEADFTGTLVSGTGLAETHRHDFLFGGRGVCMQGTGLGLNNRYITITNPRALNWHPGYAGISNEATAVFAYVDGPTGRYNRVAVGTSIAIDPNVIPPRHWVHIRSSDGHRIVGERRADDTGGAIRGAHIDVFVGAGQAVVTTWEAAGGNLTNAHVKYLGRR